MRTHRAIVASFSASLLSVLVPRASLAPLRPHPRPRRLPCEIPLVHIPCVCLYREGGYTHTPLPVRSLVPIRIKCAYTGKIYDWVVQYHRRFYTTQPQFLRWASTVSLWGASQIQLHTHSAYLLAVPEVGRARLKLVLRL